MNRQGYPAASQCCCHNHNQASQSLNIGYREQQAGEQYAVYQEPATFPQRRYRKNPAAASNQGNNLFSAVDEQTLNNLATYRKKACQFIATESDSSASPPSAPNQQYQYENANQNQYPSPNVLRQANDLIDYVPQSEFLKKMKQQCQYLQSNQPNIFSTLDNLGEHNPHDCQRCIDRTKKILTMGEQFSCSRPRSPELMIRSCSCKQRGRPNVSENQAGPTGGQNVCDDNQRLQRDPRGTEDAGERILQRSGRCGRESRATGKGSVHMSRSKKPVKRRERRKRKSGSSERCESGEESEPNLKKPHENSCERCWRYASPSRSPVNKPDQRYDPNFRRGHSCADLKQERGDGDLEIVGRPVSPCQNHQPVPNREKSPPAQSHPSRQQHPDVMPQDTQCPTHRTPVNTQILQHSQHKTHFSGQRPHSCQHHPTESHFKESSSYTKVKEVVQHSSRQKSPEKVSPKTQPCEGGRKSPTPQGILQPDTGRKARPKSYTTGVSTHRPEDIPSYAVDEKDYYNLCMQQKQGAAQTADRRSVTASGTSGHRTERPCGESCHAGPATAASPRKLASPSTTSRPGPSSKASSSPRPGSRPKTARSPEQCVPGPSTMPDGPKPGSPKARTPKTPANQNACPGTPGTDSTVYAEVSVKKPAEASSPRKSPPAQPQKTHKSPSPPQTSSKNGKSPRSGSKSSPKKSPKGLYSLSDFTESSSLSEDDTPVVLTNFPPATEYENILNAERARKYPGVHPVRECYCPPRAAYGKERDEGLEHVFCCHCNWEEKLKNQEQGSQLENDPDNLSNASNKYYIAPTDGEVKCPYREYQLERIEMNDLSWAEDNRKIREFVAKNPHFIDPELRKKWFRELSERCGLDDTPDDDTPPRKPKKSRQKMSQQSRQQMPQQSRQQMPQQMRQQSPQQSCQQMPQQSRQQMPQQARQQTPQQSCQQMPQQSCQQMPQQTRHQTPQQSCQQMPQQTRHQTPQQSCQQMPQQIRHQTPQQSCQQMPQQMRHQTPQQSCQQMPQQIRQQTPQQSCQQMPQQTRQQMPQQTRPQTPQQSCQQAPQQSGQYLPQRTPQQMPQQKSQNNPSTTYAVMYMTQNKLDKGDDIEVLVEELTQAYPNSADSRTRGITEKMKRIMQLPSDSMALRFQKGVSETFATPQSSRILYF